MDPDNIYSVTVQPIKVEDSVINVALANIIIKIAKKKLMILPTVFIVEKKVILQENALTIKKVFIEKVDHVLVVAPLDILLKIVQ